MYEGDGPARMGDEEASLTVLQGQGIRPLDKMMEDPRETRTTPTSGQLEFA